MIENKVKIGAYMIVKDEEECIEECLKSIVGFDEIVILDTGSTDRTKEIVAKYPCRYIEKQYEWNDNFAEARNAAMQYTSAAWLLVIDADEIFVGNIDAIRDAINKHINESAFKVNTVARGDYNQRHHSVRIHKNSPKVFWSGACHNYLSVSGPVIDGAEVHYGYSAAHQNDPDRALRILSKIVKNNPSCTREKYYLAREYYYRKDYKLAIYYLKYYLEKAWFWAEIADAHMMLAKCFLALNDIKSAKKECLEVIGLNTNFREALRFMANISGPGNKKRWTEFADTANNDGLLFIRGE